VIDEGAVTMPEANVIKEHMEVVGSDGAHVGMVDGLEDHRIKLTRADGDGEHHYVPTALVQDIRGNTVTLTKAAVDALAATGAA
jgi:hypothetical protein